MLADLSVLLLVAVVLSEWYPADGQRPLQLGLPVAALRPQLEKVRSVFQATFFSLLRNLLKQHLAPPPHCSDGPIRQQPFDSSGSYVGLTSSDLPD